MEHGKGGGRKRGGEVKWMGIGRGGLLWYKSGGEGVRGGVEGEGMRWGIGGGAARGR